MHSQQKLHVQHTHAHMVLCRKQNSIELAVRQPRGPQQSSLALVKLFYSQQELHVHHTDAHMVLCKKRNSIELTVRQPGIEAVKRSSRALWHLSNSCTVSRSCMYSSSCTHGPLPEAKLHRAGSATTKGSTAEQSGTCQALLQSARAACTSH